MKKALFIDATARTCSPTAAQVFESWDGVRTDFGGVAPNATDAVSTDQLDWADEIFVMEQRIAKRLQERYGPALRGKRMINLAIPDSYGFMDATLVALLIEKAGPHLR